MAEYKNKTKDKKLTKKDMEVDISLLSLPHNQDAEEGLLSSMILDSDGDTVINSCIVAKLSSSYFFFPYNQKIYEAIIDLNSRQMPCELITLAEHMAKLGTLELIGGVPELVRIAGRVETFAHFKIWLEIVREKYFLRSLIRACNKTIEEAYKAEGDFENFIDNVERQIMSISQDRVQNTAKSINGEVEIAVANINKMIQNKGVLTGIKTGFKGLDDKTRGLQNKEMIVIAARPGMGKTSIALNIAESAMLDLDKPVKVMIFSLEMAASLLIQRMVCSRARMDQSALSRGFCPNDKQQDLATAANELKNNKLWIEDSADMTILEMRAKARRMKQQHNIGLIIVDYLQLLRGTDSRAPREQQVAEISRGMKAMAKELDLPVIVLAQLNRETEKENRDPRPSDLRESGSIEQDADMILLLNWKSKAESDEKISNDQRLIKLIIAKHRNGPTGVVDLIFNRNYTRYENYAGSDYEE